MTNLENFIQKNFIIGDYGINKFNYSILNCNNGNDCKKCVGCNSTAKIITWLNSSSIDWSTIPIDTPIYVRNFLNTSWIPSYFAGYENNHVLAFTDGTTSFTTENSTTPWNYAKLAEEH